ncbi:MAG: hypothetical protein KDD73_10715 [Anaerolineales bacterium]|nr:hypothetical protein [Anaerolineales bacterium]
MVETAHQLVALQQVAESAPSVSGRLPEPTFAKLVDDAQQLRRDAFNDQLVSLGWPPNAAQSFASSLGTLRAISAFARLHHQPSATVQLAFTLIRSSDSLWLVRMVEAEKVEISQIDRATTSSLLSSWGS